MHDNDTRPAVIGGVGGGGPVGLATALQLGRLGVVTQPVEQRTGSTHHPKDPSTALGTAFERVLALGESTSTASATSAQAGSQR